jgi:hypothetical protein
LHIATLAGVSSLVALSRYVPRPFRGPTQSIVSAERATAFFHPEMSWSKLLLGPRMVHVLPWDHSELFRSRRESVAGVLKFMLEEAPALGTIPDLPPEEALALETVSDLSLAEVPLEPVMSEVNVSAPPVGPSGTWAYLASRPRSIARIGPKLVRHLRKRGWIQSSATS